MDGALRSKAAKRPPVAGSSPAGDTTLRYRPRRTSAALLRARPKAPLWPGSGQGQISDHRKPGSISGLGEAHAGL